MITELVAADIGGTHARFALARIEDCRVVKLDEGSIGFWRAVLREIVVKGLLGFTALLYWLAALWPLWNGLHRAWWDYASGTRVVRGREVR